MERDNANPKSPLLSSAARARRRARSMTAAIATREPTGRPGDAIGWGPPRPAAKLRDVDHRGEPGGPLIVGPAPELPASAPLPAACDARRWCAATEDRRPRGR